MTQGDFFVIPWPMQAKLFILFFLLLGSSLVGCTKFAVKNKATVLSAESFDNELIRQSKDQYPDPEQQKMFSDYIKKNSRLEVSNVDIKDDTATADLSILTPKTSVFPEMKGVSGREWQAKIDANMETRKYKLNLKRIKDSWEILEQKPVSP
jgi:hypothetical protein